MRSVTMGRTPRTASARAPASPVKGAGASLSSSLQPAGGQPVFFLTLRFGFLFQRFGAGDGLGFGALNLSLLARSHALDISDGFAEKRSVVHSWIRLARARGFLCCGAFDGLFAQAAFEFGEDLTIVAHGAMLPVVLWDMPPIIRQGGWICLAFSVFSAQSPPR